MVVKMYEFRIVDNEFKPSHTYNFVGVFKTTAEAFQFILDNRKVGNKIKALDSIVIHMSNSEYEFGYNNINYFENVFKNYIENIL